MGNTGDERFGTDTQTMPVTVVNNFVGFSQILAYDNIYLGAHSCISRGSRYSPLLPKRNILLVKMTHDCLCVGDGQIGNRMCSILWFWEMN